jgi:ABC-type transport system involved in multi-copper enzyme maturation permease subunit
MSDSIFVDAVVSLGLVFLQVALAIPWLAFVTQTPLREWLRGDKLLRAGIGILVGGGLLVLVLRVFSMDREFFGRLYSSVLHLQIVADLFALVFAGLLAIWPKGGAVALAAFREGVRQPMFWLLVLVGVALLTVSIVVPYFTLGDDHLMMRELGFDLIMVLPVFFAVMSASSSISEEIEGRTAITLMSKPVSRRQFLLGKYVGIFLAAFVITNLLGWVFNWVILAKHWFDRLDPVPPPFALVENIGRIVEPGSLSDFLRGAGLWMYDAGNTLPGLMLGFYQVMVLLAVAVALATRLPMVVTIPVCVVVYFLGHLTPVLVEVSKHRVASDPSGSPVFKLINFMSQAFDVFLPALDRFSLGPSGVSDNPPPLHDLLPYVGTVNVYATLYTVIVLLFGLVLFEDRDLA